MRKRRAFLLSFEGIEGTGKSTQCRMLRRFLKNKGLRLAIFREPGSSLVGERIRDVLLHEREKLTDLCEMLLFISARCQLAEELIRPMLYEKDIIILDRYLDATLAYQGYGAGIDIRLIKQLNKLAVKDLVPDLTILLDLCSEIGLERSGRNDRFEKRKISFHNRVRNGYLTLAKQNKKRIKVVSSALDISTVQNRIRKIVCHALKARD